MSLEQPSVPTMLAKLGEDLASIGAPKFAQDAHTIQHVATVQAAATDALIAALVELSNFRTGTPNSQRIAKAAIAQAKAAGLKVST